MDRSAHPEFLRVDGDSIDSEARRGGRGAMMKCSGVVVGTCAGGGGGGRWDV